MRVRPFEQTTLPLLQRPVNLKLAAVIPGWALSWTILDRQWAKESNMHC